MAETQSTNLKLDLVDGDSLFDTGKVKSNFEKIDAAVGSLTEKRDILITPKQYASGAITKGGMKEVTLDDPAAKPGYTRFNLLGAISGTGSNSATVNLHNGSVSFYAPFVDINVVATVLTLYVRD